MDAATAAHYLRNLLIRLEIDVNYALGRQFIQRDRSLLRKLAFLEGHPQVASYEIAIALRSRSPFRIERKKQRRRLSPSRTNDAK